MKKVAIIIISIKVTFATALGSLTVFLSPALTISFLQTTCQFSITDVHLGFIPFTAVMAIFSTREQSSISTQHVYTIQNIAANMHE
jgi:hypothetical protein